MSVIDYGHGLTPYLPPPSQLSTGSLPTNTATRHADRPQWRRRVAVWLTERDRQAYIERVTGQAESWAEDARVARLVKRLDAVRRAPGARPLVAADWRETAEPSPNCAGDD